MFSLKGLMKKMEKTKTHVSRNAKEDKSKKKMRPRDCQGL